MQVPHCMGTHLQTALFISATHPPTHSFWNNFFTSGKSRTFCFASSSVVQPRRSAFKCVPLAFKLLYRLFQDSRPDHWKIIQYALWMLSSGYSVWNASVLSFFLQLPTITLCLPFSVIKNHLQHICCHRNLLRWKAFCCERTAVHINVDLTRMQIMIDDSSMMLM